MFNLWMGVARGKTLMFDTRHEVEMGPSDDLRMEIGQVSQLSGIPSETLRT